MFPLISLLNGSMFAVFAIVCTFRGAGDGWGDAVLMGGGALGIVGDCDVRSIAPNDTSVGRLDVVDEGVNVTSDSVLDSDVIVVVVAVTWCGAKWLLLQGWFCQCWPIMR
jgi:hypothetical protein